MVPQLKLSLAQLIALRMQHGRTPLDKLRRMISGDLKTLVSSELVHPHSHHDAKIFYILYYYSSSPPPSSFSALSCKSVGVSITQWQAALQALHILSWLILGALSHNMVHSVASEVRSVPSSGGQLRSVASSAGQCRLLESLCLRMEEMVQRAISLTKIVLQRVVSNAELEVCGGRL